MICVRCNVDKPTHPENKESSFYRNGHCKNGWNGVCKECIKKANKVRWKKIGGGLVGRRGVKCPVKAGIKEKMIQETVDKYAKEMAILEKNNIPIDWNIDNKRLKNTNMEEYWEQIERVL